MTRATAIPETITLHVPFRVMKRGGRKPMVLLESAAQPCRTDSTLVRYVTPLLKFTNRPCRLWLMRVDAADPHLIAQLDRIERANTALFRKIDAMFDGP